MCPWTKEAWGGNPEVTRTEGLKVEAGSRGPSQGTGKLSEAERVRGL